MSNNIENKIQSVQDKYYQEHTKNKIFKKAQKKDCANKVIDEVGLNNLIEKTIYYQEGTNVIWLNYHVFKKFATDDVYDQLIKYFIELIDYGKTYYTTVEIKINLDGLTITGLERYKHIFEDSVKNLSDTHINTIDTCILMNAPTFTNQLINLCSAIIGPSRFSNLQTKLIVISKK
jgi:hypothetical protein